ncbi:MAG: STAS domain-containing protein [Ostreibacterium sp.]
MVIEKASIDSVLSDTLSVDNTNANAILAKLLALQKTQGHTVDLSVVQYCDSAGIAVLIEAKAIFARHQQTLSYLNPTQQLLELATFLKVSKLLFG